MEIDHDALILGVIVQKVKEKATFRDPQLATLPVVRLIQVTGRKFNKRTF